MISFQVTLQNVQDPTQSVTADYRYIATPGVLEARFNSPGTGLTITFDQPTDRAGATKADVCDNVIKVLLPTFIAPIPSIFDMSGTGGKWYAWTWFHMHMAVFFSAVYLIWCWPNSFTGRYPVTCR